MSANFRARAGGGVLHKFFSDNWALHLAVRLLIINPLLNNSSKDPAW